MPAYEYQCEECSGHFVERQKMSDPEIEFCPTCGGAVKRLISGGAGVISKGGASSYCGAGAGCDPGGPGCAMNESAGCGGMCACHG
jgi:putative FmdB family regulatory protein